MAKPVLPRLPSELPSPWGSRRTPPSSSSFAWPGPGFSGVKQPVRPATLVRTHRFTSATGLSSTGAPSVLDYSLPAAAQILGWPPYILLRLSRLLRHPARWYRSHAPAGVSTCWLSFTEEELVPLRQLEQQLLAGLPLRRIVAQWQGNTARHSSASSPSLPPVQWSRQAMAEALMQHYQQTQAHPLSPQPFVALRQWLQQTHSSH